MCDTQPAPFSIEAMRRRGWRSSTLWQSIAAIVSVMARLLVMARYSGVAKKALASVSGSHASTWAP